MSDATESTPTITRRDFRRQARRRKWGAIASAIAVTGGIVLVGLLVTDTVRVPVKGPTLARADERKVSIQEAAGEPADPTRALTCDDPLQLWIAGDSLAGSLGPSLGDMVADTGVVETTFDSRVSSGFNNAGFFDWPEHAAEELVDLKPEAVVFWIGTNDAKNLPNGDGWQSAYGEKIDEMMTLLVGNGRDVYWVGVPTMSDSSFSKRAAKVNTVVQEVAATHPEVTYVDAYTLFADDEDGEYKSTLRDSDGDLVTVRAGDGVHLTPAGGDRIAEAVFFRLDATWNANEQAVEDCRQPIHQTAGATQVHGTYRSPSSGSSGGTSSTTTAESSSTTTPASTAPASTAPPESTAPPPPSEPPPSSTP